MKTIYSKLRFLSAFLFVCSFNAAAMEAVIEADPVTELVNYVKDKPEQAFQVLQVLRFRALMFESFVGEFLSVSSNQDDPDWDQAFFSFLTCESEDYEKLDERAQTSLANLDQSIAAQGSELSFEALMLIERARRELWTEIKELNRLSYEIRKIRAPLPPNAIYSPTGNNVLVTLNFIRSKLNESPRNNLIRESCDTCERSVNQINQILGIDGKAHVANVIEIYKQSKTLKRLYNEAYIRIYWNLEDHKNHTVDMLSLPLAVFPVDCLVDPPTCLAKAPSELLNTVSKLVYQTISCRSQDQEKERVSGIQAFKKKVPKARHRVALHLNKVAFDIVSLRPWAAFEFRQNLGERYCPGKLKILLAFHKGALSQLTSNWLSGTVLDEKYKKEHIKKDSKKSAKKKVVATPNVETTAKKAEPIAVVASEPVLEEVALEAAPRLENTNDFANGLNLLRGLFNYDRVVHENDANCIYKQNLANGRQNTVLLFNTGRLAGFNSDDYDVTAFKIKDDAFHTISPLLWKRAHFGYIVDTSNIDDVDGVHTNLQRPIRFNAPTQKALVIPAKIINSQFLSGDQAISHPGTSGAYVFIFDGNTCFHAMFHQSL